MDLEDGSPLMLLTDEELGHRLVLTMKDVAYVSAASLTVDISSGKVEYHVDSCAQESVNLPGFCDTRIRIWKIVLVAESVDLSIMKVQCNGEEVFSFTISDSTCEATWRDIWSKQVHYIQFVSATGNVDNATKGYKCYRPGKK